MRKKFIVIFAFIAVVCCALMLAACGDNEGNVEVTGITLDETEITLTESEYYTLTATITPSNATNQDIEWTSSDTKVATVEYGNVYAAAGGEAVITVTSNNGKTASCTVKVEKAEEESPTQYTVKFYANGGEFENGKDVYEIQVDEGTKLESVTVTREGGYNFTGWYAGWRYDEAVNVLWDFENDTVSEDINLYAYWKYPNKYQSVIDALAARIKTERQSDSEEVVILTVFTDNDGCLCFVEKDVTGAFSYKTDISGYEEVKGNAEIISAIPTTNLTLLKNYNDTYTSDNNSAIADYMAIRYSLKVDTIIYSCVSEWEDDGRDHYLSGGPWYRCKVKAIVADGDGQVYDYSITVVASVTNFDLVTGGNVLSEDFDEMLSALGEVADDFYAERIKEMKA